MNIQIRKATLDDLAYIDKIENSLEHRILSSNLLNSTLDSSNYYYFVAILDDSVVGYLAVEYMVDHLDILSIAVFKEHRRKNIAHSLIENFIEMCKKIDINDIFLEVRVSNESAISFYEKEGFEKISCRKNYYTSPIEDAYIYKKAV